MSYSRKVVVEFITPQGTKRLDGVDVKFDINLPMSAIMTTAKVGILNLAREDIEYLTTYTSRWSAIIQRKRLRVFAGYEDTELALIFDGDIINALPTQPPEIWLNCEAQSGAYGSTQMFSESILVPSNIQTVANEAAGWMGMSLDWKSTSKKTIDKFDFTGSRTQLMQSISKLGNIIPFEENGNLVIVDRDNPERDGVIREISEQSGMVFVPDVDYIGVTVSMFLDTRIKRGDTVNLVSKRIPAASGLYYVYNIRHHGQLRGNSFYTTIKARRRDTYGSELT